MDMGSYFRFVAALVFVLGLIGIIALLARRLVPGARTVNRGKKRRLALIEVLPLDAKRRLVLVRRDDTEHLLVLSPNGDVVVERNIGTTFDQLLGDQVPAPTPKGVVPPAPAAPPTATAPNSTSRTDHNDRNMMP